MDRQGASKEMTYAMSLFRKNPSAENYLLLKGAILRYQEIVKNAA
jgi:hypothetical protein